jgi:hypothetical protein
LQWIAAPPPPPQLSHSEGAQRSLEERHQGRRKAAEPPLRCSALAPPSSSSSLPRPRFLPAAPHLPINMGSASAGPDLMGRNAACLRWASVFISSTTHMLILSSFFFNLLAEAFVQSQNLHKHISLHPLSIHIFSLIINARFFIHNQ